MAKIYGYYEYDGSLTPGQSEDGGLSQLLFDSEGKLSDHASFHPVERDDDETSYDSASSTGESDPDADTQAAALLVLAAIGAGGGYVLIRKATPHVQRMINERTVPAVRSFWNKVRGQGSETIAPRTDDADAVTLTRPAGAVRGTQVNVAPPQMSVEEWYARFRAMFEARSLAEAQWNVLSSVQVTEVNVVAELQREIARNRPDAGIRTITTMLKAEPEIEASAGTEPIPIEVERDSWQRPSELRPIKSAVPETSVLVGGKLLAGRSTTRHLAGGCPRRNCHSRPIP